MKQFFIADIHHNHHSLLTSMDHRNFKDVEEMHDVMIKNWNNAVSKGDEVYILGDISFGKPNECVDFYSKLNGTKYLITGNHDRKLIKDNKVQRLFKEIVPYKELRFDHKLLVLCHYPILAFNKRLSGSYHFYGHIHTTKENDWIEKFKQELKDAGEPCNMVNVGCMLPWMNYTPRTFEEIINYEAT